MADLNIASYFEGVKSPLEMALQGYQVGSALRIQNEKAEAEALKAQELERQKKEAEEMKNDLLALSQRKEATVRDYIAMITRYPVMAEHLKAPMEQLSAEQADVHRKDAMTLFSALDSGQTDVAEKMLNDRLTAAKNSGDDQAAASAEVMLNIVKTNPGAAKTSAGLMLASTMGPEKFAETWGKIQDEERKQLTFDAEVDKTAADLDLTKAQTKQALAGLEKTDAETRKLALELAALEKGGGTLAPDKVFDAEDKLRKEYYSQTQNFDLVQDAFRRVQSAEDTAAGDLSLIFSYMKMLDPNSVVREGEFANAQNAGGISDKVYNIYNKVLTGERLTVGQRKNFTSQSKKLMTAAGQKEKDIRKGLQRIIDNYKLNPQNVFTLPGADKGYTKYAEGEGE